MDLTGYDRYFAGELHDYEFPDELLAESLEKISGLPKPPANKSGKW